MLENSTLLISARSLMLLAATAIALTAKNSPEVKRYFVVQFVTTLGTEIVLNIWGWQSNIYRVAYCFASMAILTASWGIVWPGRRKFLLVTVNAIFLFVLACFYLPVVRPLDTVILLVAGMVTLFLGMALTLRVEENKSVYGPLAILWLLLGAFSVIHAMEPTPFWDDAADWLSYWLAAGCFLWIGVGRKFVIKNVKAVRA